MRALSAGHSAPNTTYNSFHFIDFFLSCSFFFYPPFSCECGWSSFSSFTHTFRFFTVRNCRTVGRVFNVCLFFTTCDGRSVYVRCIYQDAFIQSQLEERTCANGRAASVSLRSSLVLVLAFYSWEWGVGGQGFRQSQDSTVAVMIKSLLLWHHNNASLGCIVVQFLFVH